jgi:hypothetical protein
LRSGRSTRPPATSSSASSERTTFAVVALSRTRLWIVFGGSVFLLIGLAAFVFALLKWGSYMAFRRRDEPQLPPPKFGA